MSTEQERLHRLADDLFHAFEDNDPAGVAACCDEEAVFSRNGRRSGVMRDLLSNVGTLHERIGRHRYVEVRRELFPGGFVEEHRVVTVLPSGIPYTVAACVIGRIGPSGKLCELAEYLDPATGQPIATR
jgi:hypothetical protein